jgi:hypothetical protein
MNDKKITITIPRDPAKGVSIAVEGHAGPCCQGLTKAIETALGVTTGDSQTQEFNQVEQQQQQQQQTGW